MSDVVNHSLVRDPDVRLVLPVAQRQLGKCYFSDRGGIGHVLQTNVKTFYLGKDKSNRYDQAFVVVLFHLVAGRFMQQEKVTG